MSPGVTRQDISELKSNIKDLYDKHNETNKAISGMAVNVAEIATTMKARPIPEQPCAWHDQLRKEFDGHIDVHNENVRDWKEAFIKASVDIIKLAVVAGLGLIIGMMVE